MFYSDPLAGLQWYSPTFYVQLPVISEDSLLNDVGQIKIVQQAMTKLGLAEPVSLTSVAKAFSQYGDTFTGYIADGFQTSLNINLSETAKDTARKALRTVLEAIISKSNEELKKQGKAPVTVPTVSNTAKEETETTDYKPYAIGFSVLLFVTAMLIWIKKS